MSLKFTKFMVLFFILIHSIVFTGCKAIFVKDPVKTAAKQEKKGLKETQKAYKKAVKEHYKAQDGGTEKRMKKNYRGATKNVKRNKKKSYWRCR